MTKTVLKLLYGIDVTVASTNKLKSIFHTYLGLFVKIFNLWNPQKLQLVNFILV